MVVETPEMGGFAQGEFGERRGLSVESLEPFVFSGEVMEVGQRRLRKSTPEMAGNWERAFIRSNKTSSKSINWVLPCVVIDFADLVVL